jgi:hypothetical protein
MVLLEPIATLEIEVPDEYAGAVMGDISSISAAGSSAWTRPQWAAGHQGPGALRRGRALLTAPALDHEWHRNYTIIDRGVRTGPGDARKIIEEAKAEKDS